MNADLNEVGESDAHHHELVHDPQQFWICQHAVLQTIIKEISVVGQDIIDSRHLRKNF